MDTLWITVGVVVALPLGFIVVPAIVDAMMRFRRRPARSSAAR